MGKVRSKSLKKFIPKINEERARRAVRQKIAESVKKRDDKLLKEIAREDIRAAENAKQIVQDEEDWDEVEEVVEKKKSKASKKQQEDEEEAAEHDESFFSALGSDDEEEEDEDDEDEEEEDEISDEEVARHEEEDAEEDAKKTPAERKTQKKSANARFKKDMDSIRESDPELYALLQESGEVDEEDDAEDDEEDMDDSEGEAEADSEDEEEDDEEESPKKKSSATKSTRAHSNPLTIKQINLWIERALKDKSGASLSLLTVAFKCAVTVTDTPKEGSLPPYFDVSSDAVYQKVLVASVKNIPNILINMLVGDRKKEQEKILQNVATSPRYKQVLKYIKSFLRNLIQLLKTAVDPILRAFVLKCTERALPLFNPLEISKRMLLRVLLDSLAHDNESVRLYAFICLRSSMTRLSAPFPAMVLKGVYLTYTRSSRFFNSHQAARIHFMGNCVVELFGLDFTLSYQYAFVYIRQLAITLKQCVNDPKLFDRVVNWQFVNSLRIWCRLIAAYPQDRDLRMLAYPISQIATGAIRLVPSSRYFPMRFALIESLNHLSKHTNFFIPVAPLLLEVFSSKPFTQTTGFGTAKTHRAGVDIHFSISAPKSIIKTAAYRDALTDETVFLLLEYLAINSHSIAYPELAVPVRRALRELQETFTKNRDDAVSRKLKQVTNKMDESIEFVLVRRASCKFSPRDMEQVLGFQQAIQYKWLPLQSGSSNERDLNKGFAKTPLIKTYLEFKQKRDDTFARLESASRLQKQQSAASSSSAKAEEKEEEEEVEDDEDVDAFLAGEEDEEDLADAYGENDEEEEEKPRRGKQEKRKRDDKKNVPHKKSKPVVSADALHQRQDSVKTLSFDKPAAAASSSRPAQQSGKKSKQ